MNDSAPTPDAGTDKDVCRCEKPEGVLCDGSLMCEACGCWVATTKAQRAAFYAERFARKPAPVTQSEREEMARAVLSVVMDSHYAGAVADKLIALGYRKPAAPDEERKRPCVHNAPGGKCYHSACPLPDEIPPAAPDAPCPECGGSRTVVCSMTSANDRNCMRASWSVPCPKCAAAPDAPTPGEEVTAGHHNVYPAHHSGYPDPNRKYVVDAATGYEHVVECHRRLLRCVCTAPLCSRPSEASHVQREGKCSCVFGHGDGDWLSRNCPVHRSSAVQPEGTDADLVLRRIDNVLRDTQVGSAAAFDGTVEGWDRLRRILGEAHETIAALRSLHPEGDGKRGSSVRDEGSRPAASSELRSGEAT
jgi:hypothetical protein